MSFYVVIGIAVVVTVIFAVICCKWNEYNDR